MKALLVFSVGLYLFLQNGITWEALRGKRNKLFCGRSLRFSMPLLLLFCHHICCLALARWSHTFRLCPCGRLYELHLQNISHVAVALVFDPIWYLCPFCYGWLAAIGTILWNKALLWFLQEHTAQKPNYSVLPLLCRDLRAPKAHLFAHLSK